VALDPITHQWESHKVGTRVRVRTGVNDGDPKLKGVVAGIEPAGTGDGSLELYTIVLDRPSYHRLDDSKTRPEKDPWVWRTDSSMTERIPVLDDLSEL
jgi:hypothetical protein